MDDRNTKQQSAATCAQDRLKAEALEFANSLAETYFVKRDFDALARLMGDGVSCIGTGEGEISLNAGEMGKALLDEFGKYPGGFTIKEQWIEALPCPDDSCLVYGMVDTVAQDGLLADNNQRFTLLVKKTEQGMRLLHMHVSRPDDQQEKGHYYVQKSAKTNIGELRQKLDISNRQLDILNRNIPGGAHQCKNDPYFTLISVSDSFLSMVGYTREEIERLFHNNFIEMVYPGDRAMLRATTSELLKKGRDIELECRVMPKSGPPIWILDKARLLDNGNGEENFFCLLLEITERKKAQENLRLSLERYQVIMDQATDIIFEWDIKSDTLFFSQNWYKKFGYEAMNKQISVRIPLSRNIHPEDIPAFVKIMTDTAAGVPYSETEFRIRDIYERFYWCRIRATTQFDSDGRAIRAVGVIVDIDEEKKQKQELLFKAQYDALTGIYNKATVNALVEQRMKAGYTSGNGVSGYHALLIIDVDHFKAVNDSYGHLCGDSVLSDVAAALKGSVRGSDLVGRIGGDEFLVYLPEVADELSVQRKAEQMMRTLSCIRPEAGVPPITCSIGAAVLPRSQNDYQVLYETADRALYRRKNGGRDGFAFYEPEMEKSLPGRSVTAVGNSIVSDECNVADEWLAQYAFRTLYEAKDTQAALDKLLEIIGRSFDVSRVYIFENSGDGKTCSNTFEWCGDGVTRQMQLLQDISYIGDLGDYQKNFDGHGIFYCREIESLAPDMYAMLRPQGIRSMLQCAILDEGEFIGYVGFDECREHRAWNERQIAAFRLTANVLSVFLMKLRQKHR